MSRPATTARPRPKSVNLGSTTGSLSNTITLKCQVCSKKYEAKNSFGLHVCIACTERGGAPEAKKPVTFSKPKSIICYVCGREFFQDSIKIHIPQCLKKRAVAQSKLPPDMRTTLVKPRESRESNEEKISPTGGSRKTIEQQNEEAYEIYKASLVPCDNCGRTFSSPDRLQVHLRSCRADAPARAPPARASTKIERPSTSKDSGSDDAVLNKKPQWKRDHEKFQQMLKAGKSGGNAPMVIEDVERDDGLVPCPHCSRRFSETAAERHIPKCANIVNKPKPPPSRNSLSMTTPITQNATSSPTTSTSPNKRLSVSSISPSRPKSVSLSSPSKGLPTINNSSPKEINLFCGGCGTKYTSSSSKFCGGCGRKR